MGADRTPVPLDVAVLEESRSSPRVAPTGFAPDVIAEAWHPVDLQKQQRDTLSILRQLHDGQPWLPAPGSC